MNLSPSAAPGVLSEPLTLKLAASPHEPPKSQPDAVAFLRRSVEELGDQLHVVPRVGDGQILLVLGLERGLLFRVFEPVLAVGEADGVGLAGSREVFATAARVLAEVAQRRGVDGLDVDDLGEPVGQVEVELARRAAAEPLAVTDDDVERRRLLAEIEKHLILVVAPGDLVNLDRHARFLLVVVAELLQSIGGRPLCPPDRDGLRALLFSRRRRGSLHAGGAFVFFAADESYETDCRDEAR
jgi:hypothetical protein